jgi:hypothetical protein
VRDRVGLKVPVASTGSRLALPVLQG